MVANAEKQDRYDANAPPWVTSPWDEEKSFFELLGVAEAASAEEIEEAHQRLWMAAGCVEGALSPGVKYARDFLLGDGDQRKRYRELLAYCRSKQPVRIEPASRPGFVRFCELTRLKCWSDPKREHEWHIRRAGQEPPGFVAEKLRRDEGREREEERKRERERLADKREGFAYKRFLLRLGYAFGFVILVGMASGWSFDDALTLFLRALGVVDQRAETRLEKDGREALALATDAMSQLDTGLNSLRDTVRRDVNAPLESRAGLPEDLIAIIDREPTVAAAWRTVQAAYAAREGFGAQETLLVAATGRIRDKTFLKADVETLREIKTWAAASLAGVASQQQHLEHIRAMLEVERFRRAGERPAKEP
jgi:hypothetical protein